MTKSSSVDRIAAAVRAGQLDLARTLFERAYAAATTDNARTALLADLARTVTIPRDAILVAHMTRTTHNPVWTTYGWRCGPCHRRWVAGTGAPAVGNGYKTSKGALKGARTHADRHPGIQIITEG
ncbi:hypothetical protein [Actinomadura harenae]|uniref:Uncharacterized protein n=1 Tax=Actinomadura harenae TaxID=2483351 RepID=A0A3M2M6S5_9ACTN|nr:hypothetical protein [Actinomadura harenae]RMI45296.1 hypothetical protein EBO15_10240 [Actinomadura harenae]